MSDVYFLQVSGNNMTTLAETLVEQARQRDSELAAADNIIIVPEEVEPLSRTEALRHLEKMADALDVEVVEDESSCGN
jgi:hypothetical protein